VTTFLFPESIARLQVQIWCFIQKNKKFLKTSANPPVGNVISGCRSSKLLIAGLAGVMKYHYFELRAVSLIQFKVQSDFVFVLAYVLE